VAVVILSWQDPNDNTIQFQGTGYQYDDLDRVIKVTDHKGNIYETVYDANGQIYQEKVWHIQPNDLYIVRTVATHQYDAADRRISTTDVLGKTTQFAYDAAGNLTKVTDANGHVTQYEYDAMNRRTAVIDGNGHRTETKYNLRGEAIAVTNANGETVKSEYDEIGRLIKVINPLGHETRFQYDANGNLTCLIDANALSNTGDPGHQPLNADGCSESRQYDELNRLKQSKDAQGRITAYSYDLLGDRLAITDAENHTTAFHYDDFGRLTEIVDPLVETPTDKTQTFVYDEADNVVQTTDRKGQTTQYIYDVLNRPIQALHWVDNSIETFVYDDFDDLIQTQNADVSYLYSYDAKHQLQSKTDNRSNKTLSWTYDPVGNLDTKTDYQGNVTDYQYDSANRLVAETNPNYLQVSYHYDGAGRLIDRILSNGAQTRYQYDSAGRLTQLKNTTVTGQIVNNTSYTRDRIGNILTQTEASGSGQTAGTTSYSYDPEYRLLTADYPGTANDESFSYDKVGNRKTYTKAGATKYYNVDAGNRLKDIRTGSATGTVFESYSYDDNGSLTTIGGNRSLTLTWDANNRVKQINTSQYQYDPSGYRIQKAAGATNRYYLEGEHLEAIYSDTGSLKAQYLRGSVIDEIVNGYQKDASDKLVNYTYHHDALQSVLGQSGHQGSILSTQTYGAFGNSLGSTGTSSNAQQYTGREKDGDSGFYYYRARYYDPSIGRFISEDPMGFAAGINFYAYVNNNPINANDPTGHCGPLTPLCAAAVRGALASIGIGGAIRGGVAAATGDDVSSAVLNPGAIGFDASLGALTGGGGAFAKAWQTSQIGNIKTLGEIGNDLALAKLSQRGLTLEDNLASQIYLRVPGTSKTPIVDFAYKAGDDFAGVEAKMTGNLWNFSWSYTAAQKVGYGLIDDGATATMFGTKAVEANIAGNSLTSIERMHFTPWDTTTIWDSVLPSFGASGLFNTGSALGGFVLYPNKANTNMMRSVYSK
jgi:RHS repeat-associated protein